MGTPNEYTPYYVDDITLLPLRVMWRMIRLTNRWPKRIPLFFYFLASKLVGSRGVAVYGLARPDELTEIDWKSIPAEAQSALQPVIQVCRKAGFQLIASFQSQAIGFRRGYSVVWLHSIRYVYATAVWLEMRRGEQSRSKTVFACHSLRSNGQRLDSAAYTRIEWNPEIVPPGHDILNTWPETSPQKIFAMHLQRTKAEFELQHFDDDSVRLDMLTKGQHLFDHMINKGYFVQLTKNEVDRIRRLTI